MARLIPLVLLVAALVACGGPSATQTPAFARYTADQVVTALQPLGITGVGPHVRDPQAVAPNTYSDGRDFTIPIVAPKGGQVLIFASATDLAAMQAWFARFPDLAPYVYTKGNALIQLNNTLPKAEAMKYEAALAAMK
jgi:hypothetical protein